MATLRQSLAIERLRLSRREKTGKYKVWFHSAIKRYDHHFKSKESNLFDGKIVKLPSNVDFLYLFIGRKEQVVCYYGFIKGSKLSQGF